MTVYVVIGGYDYDPGDVLLVTTDREKAEQLANAKWDEKPWYSRFDYVEVERWNAATGEHDSGYQTRVTP